MKNSGVTRIPCTESIYQGINILKKGISVMVGNGMDIKVWSDPWSHVSSALNQLDTTESLHPIYW